jgi:hypothetical protein
MLSNKYLNKKSLTEVKEKPTDSHFLRGLTNVKDEVCGSFK